MSVACTSCDSNLLPLKHVQLFDLPQYIFVEVVATYLNRVTPHASISESTYEQCLGKHQFLG